MLVIGTKDDKCNGCYITQFYLLVGKNFLVIYADNFKDNLQ